MESRVDKQLYGRAGRQGDPETPNAISLRQASCNDTAKPFSTLRKAALSGIGNLTGRALPIRHKNN